MLTAEFPATANALPTVPETDPGARIARVRRFLKRSPAPFWRRCLDSSSPRCTSWDRMSRPCEGN